MNNVVNINDKNMKIKFEDIELSQDKIDKKIISVKKLAGAMNTFEKFSDVEEWRIIKYIERGKEVAFALAEFQCENCETEKNLTVHHMVLRRNRHYMDKLKYFVQRNYFGSLAILCRDCHTDLHNIENENAGVWKKDKLLRIMLKFKKLNNEKKNN